MIWGRQRRRCAPVANPGAGSTQEVPEVARSWAWAMMAWQSWSWPWASGTGTFQLAAAHSWSLIRMARLSRSLSRADRRAFTAVNSESFGVVDSIALVDAFRVAAPNSPTLELSCL